MKLPDDSLLVTNVMRNINFLAIKNVEGKIWLSKMFPFCGFMFALQENLFGIIFQGRQELQGLIIKIHRMNVTKTPPIIPAYCSIKF